MMQRITENVFFYGLPGVGQTQLINVLLAQPFQDAHKPTTDIKMNNEMNVGTVQYVDIPGAIYSHDTFLSVLPNIKILCLVCDINNHNSLPMLISICRPIALHKNRVKIILIATKYDLYNHALSIPSEKIEAFVKANNIDQYFLVSAKTLTNVSLLQEYIQDAISVELMINESIQSSDSILHDTQEEIPLNNLTNPVVLCSSPDLKKAPFLNRLLNLQLEENYSPTIVQCLMGNGVQYLDCSMEEKYQNIVHEYLRHANQIYFLFDLHEAASFDFIKACVPLMAIDDLVDLHLIGISTQMRAKSILDNDVQNFIKLHHLEYHEVFLDNPDTILLLSSDIELKIKKTEGLRSFFKNFNQERYKTDDMAIVLALENIYACLRSGRKDPHAYFAINQIELQRALRHLQTKDANFFNFALRQISWFFKFCGVSPADHIWLQNLEKNNLLRKPTDSSLKSLSGEQNSSSTIECSYLIKKR